MPVMFSCQNCHQEKSVDPRQKDRQKYCGEPACQRARKAAWQRKKMATDAAYRERQKESQQRWCRDRPQHQYQQEYRSRKPDYVSHNRALQRIRNLKRRAQCAQPGASQKIVKMDASRATAIPAGTYELRPFTMDASEKIVKMDAWVVELKAVSTISSLNPP